MHVTVPPPTHTAPSASCAMCTRPARPSAVPWLATYGAVARPLPSSHCATDALRLPVTGSSTDAPSLGKNARSSNAVSDPAALRADHADVEIARVGADRQHGVGILEQHGDPARPVVRPRDVDDLRPVDAQHPRDALDVLVVDGAGADQRRRGEREPVIGAPDRHQPGAALLHDHVVLLRAPAGLEPRVAGAERRMPGERQLQHRREDPHAVVRGRVLGREHERRLGQVRPVREALELRVVEPARRRARPPPGCRDTAAT